MPRIYIREYRVLGAKEFPNVAIEEAVYPYLGPGRTEEDVEQARTALEKAYHDQGYQAASVQVPPQSGRRGIIFLQVSEGNVARLRVKGARYFLPSAIKAKAKSLAEGQAVNFNKVTRDIVALNQLPDRQVTPSLTAGAEPGTVDVELTVKDKFPLHGSIDLNNRYSADTSPLRVSISASYTNLWQAGHTIGASFQTAPQDPDQAKAYAGYYIWRFSDLDWLSLLATGTKSDSNVSTLGGIASAGRGETLGGRAIITLPPGKNFYQSFNFGLDYKHFDQDITTAGITDSAPVYYYPLSAAYTASWVPKGSITELNLSLMFGLRGAGSKRQQFAPGSFQTDEFNNTRFDAGANFVVLRGDLSHTHELPAGFLAYAKVEGQLTDQPLVNSEQFPGGGVGTARGYLEAEVLGDSAIFGTIELRSPTLLSWLPATWGANEWRIYLFTDFGALRLNDPLPEQQDHFTLASYGIGSRLQLAGHLLGAIDVAMPTISQVETRAGDPFVSFSVSAEF